MSDAGFTETTVIERLRNARTNHPASAVAVIRAVR